MNQHRQEKRYKEWLSLQKELNELRRKLRELPLIELKSPYQHGWIIYPDFRDDIKRRADYPILKEVLKLIKLEGFTKNPAVVRHIRQNREWDAHPYSERDGKYKTIWRIDFRRYYPREFERNVEDKLKKYFYKTTDIYGREVYRHNLPHYYFIVKDRHNVITHVRQRGGAMESRLQFLEDKYYSYHEFWHGYNGSYPAYKDRSKVRAQIQKFIKGEVEDIPIEKIPKEWEH